PELRERLGLPSEPAEGRAGGPQPGGTVAPSAPMAATPATPPTATPGAPVAATSPRLDGTGASPLPRLDLTASPGMPPELGANPSPEEATLEAEALPELDPAEPVPALEAEPPLDATTDPAIELRAFDGAGAPSRGRWGVWGGPLPRTRPWTGGRGRGRKPLPSPSSSRSRWPQRNRP